MSCLQDSCDLLLSNYVRLKQVSCLTRGVKGHNQAQDCATIEAAG